ncbi:hypothetical protein KC19_9G147500, partial [Ceratodon purpureus]
VCEEGLYSATVCRIVVEVTTPTLDPVFASVVLRLCSEFRSPSIGVRCAESSRSCPEQEGLGGDRLPALDATLPRLNFETSCDNGSDFLHKKGSTQR